MRMPSYVLSTIAPNARSASMWKLIGRSPMRQPPRSGMSASPSRCRSGPQKRIGMRDAPACASISSKWADTAPLGSRCSVPSSSPSTTRTPCTSRSERTTCTSLMSGTSRSTLVVSPRRAATIALVARFFAPLTSTRPVSGRPPRIARVSPDNSRSPDFGSAESLKRVFIRWDLIWFVVEGCEGAFVRRRLVQRTGSVRGRHASRRASNCAILSSLRRVSPMSSSPSMSRHLV